MSRSTDTRYAGRPRRPWLFFALLLTAILLACREAPAVDAAEKRTPTPGTTEVEVGALATLQEVFDTTGAAMAGVRGVRLIRGGKEITPQLGMRLHEGDRILTDANTGAVIASEGGPKISLGPQSDLTLRQESVFLSLGSVLVAIKRVFRVETEFFVAGVKGTELAVSVGSDAVMALVLDGTVEMQSKEEKWTPRAYTKGKGCVVRGAAAPETLTRNAIGAFHLRDYDTAVALYDQALRADPGNAYVLNLKAYSLFKSKRLSTAIGAQKESVRVDPTYAWGYFDLARFQCAAGNFDEARENIKIAKEKGGTSLSRKMKGDGEFRRLCAPVLE